MRSYLDHPHSLKTEGAPGRLPHIYNLIKQGQFPKPMRLGVRAVGWDSREIDEWIAERLKARV
ncbi:AlpA family phage regulatory protein [Salinisphaera hydrothermalis]|uniref:AlpA family phage regulatory protein n=1 Tax=Salinisphaera hydrothermalis TaxID=563188 RepID=UPI0005699272|nr:AlpA family phage regulatory protein [Salinisphaera hydrothermalis]